VGKSKRESTANFPKFPPALKNRERNHAQTSIDRAKPHNLEFSLRAARVPIPLLQSCIFFNGHLDPSPSVLHSVAFSHAVHSQGLRGDATVKGTNNPTGLLLVYLPAFELLAIRKERAGIGDEPELQA
jgi:hypothetical protein